MGIANLPSPPCQPKSEIGLPPIPPLSEERNRKQLNPPSPMSEIIFCCSPIKKKNLVHSLADLLNVTTFTHSGFQEEIIYAKKCKSWSTFILQKLAVISKINNKYTTLLKYPKIHCKYTTKNTKISFVLHFLNCCRKIKQKSDQTDNLQ